MLALRKRERENKERVEIKNGEERERERKKNMSEKKKKMKKWSNKGVKKEVEKMKRPTSNIFFFFLPLSCRLSCKKKRHWEEA